MTGPDLPDGWTTRSPAGGQRAELVPWGDAAALRVGQSGLYFPRLSISVVTQTALFHQAKVSREALIFKQPWIRQGKPGIRGETGLLL